MAAISNNIETANRVVGSNQANNEDSSRASSRRQMLPSAGRSNRGDGARLPMAEVRSSSG